MITMGVAKAKPAASGRLPIQLNVKLTPGADRSGTIKSLSAFPGVEQVVQTFPKESDPELSRLYVLKLKPSQAKSALRQLQNHPDIEYVEGAAPRKLIW
jgi:hypothetical protein